MTDADDTPAPESTTPDAAETPSWTVEEVEAEAVRPLRLKYLRPGGEPADVEYKTDEEDSARHFAAKDAEGNVVGVGSMHHENRVAGIAPYGIPGMRIRGMAVEDEWRGRGVGADLIEAMVKVGCAGGMQEVWANARSENLGFYQRTRFKPVSSAFEIPKIGEHVVMARGLGREAKRIGKKAKDAEPAEDSDAS